MKKETKHGLKVFAGTLLLFGFGLLTLYALLKVGQMKPQCETCTEGCVSFRASGQVCKPKEIKINKEK